MTTRHDGQGIRVSVPVLFPSGSGAAVEILAGGEQAFVSDIGLGHLEAEYGGASEYFDAQAKRAADQFGVSYDGYSIFALSVPLDRIEGGIAAIANASVRAASLAILRAVEDKDRRQNDVVYERITRVFDKKSVAKTMDLRGQRDHYSAHNVVLFPSGEKAVFEFVSPHRNSISNKFLMFSDLVDSEAPLALNAVIESRAAMPSVGAMLEDVGNFIELAANDNLYRQYAHLRAA
jgi:hypothetical protein